MVWFLFYERLLIQLCFIMTVIPFNSNAGYGVGSGFQTVKELCPDSKVLKGFSIKGGIERDGVLFVMKGEKAKEAEKEERKWLQQIKVIE